MDWERAIERNHEALVAIVATLFAMLGLQSGGSVARISRELHRAVLRVLRPAESAVRRLIIIAARGIRVELPPSRPSPKGRIAGKGGTQRTSFQLFDSRKRFAFVPLPIAPRVVPRIRFLGDPRHFHDPHLVPLFAAQQPAAAEPVQPPPQTGVNAERLCRRLNAMKQALDDLPYQAKRLARWRARREKMPSPKFTSPLRPGPAPGRRWKPVHDVDHVLIECHWLAHDAMKPDTS